MQSLLDVLPSPCHHQQIPIYWFWGPKCYPSNGGAMAKAEASVEELVGMSSVASFAYRKCNANMSGGPRASAT